MSETTTSVKDPWYKAVYKNWMQGWTLVPNRKFAPEEMSRAGDQPLPGGFEKFVIANNSICLAFAYLFNEEKLATWIMFEIGLFSITQIWAVRQVWKQPTRDHCTTVMIVSAIPCGILVAVGYGVSKSASSTQVNALPFVAFLTMFALSGLTLSMLTMLRSQQVGNRLRELEEHDSQLQLTRRLATAQIHPHFVFNTLASLTHWVETQDPRAAPLLHDFNAYLRATLPMFERDSQPLQEELDLVKRYMAIMQARLGDRLIWSVDVDPALSALPLPPGSLLTLVENAITHGIEPAIRGGSVRVSATRKGDQASIEVVDTGVGLDGTAVDGLGLANTRQRLVTLHPRAGLSLHGRGESGCMAMIKIPA